MVTKENAVTKPTGKSVDSNRFTMGQWKKVANINANARKYTVYLSLLEDLICIPGGTARLITLM